MLTEVNYVDGGGGGYKVYKGVKYKAAGSMTVTGVGFEPKEIYVCLGSQILTNIDSNGNAGNTLYEIGSDGNYSGNTYGTLTINNDGFTDNYSFSAFYMGIVCIG